MNEKYKIIVLDANGKTQTVTENHPNLTATNDQKRNAAEQVANNIFNGGTAVRIDLNSDTTVWTAE